MAINGCVCLHTFRFHVCLFSNTSMLFDTKDTHRIEYKLCQTLEKLLNGNSLQSSVPSPLAPVMRVTSKGPTI